MSTTTETRQSQETKASPQTKRSRSVKGGGITALTWVLGLLFFFPVFWMVLTAFKQERDAYTDVPKLFFTPTLDQFRGVLDSGMGPYLLNSTFATVMSTVVILLLAVPASYALSIRPVEKTQDVLFFFISTKMLPIVAVIVPLYIISQKIHLLDNIWALVILYSSMNLPIAVWMLRSFMLEIPKEVLEAAEVDGAGLRPMFRYVLLPMLAPGIAATALICVIFAWNEFFFSINLTASRAATVPVFLVGFITSEGLYWAQLSAAATLAALPVVIAGWVAQNQLVRGLSMGAIK